MYRWKDTIGPLEERPTNKNFWGYNQSYGIGFYEYFQFAEDLGAIPLPVVPVGVNACGGTNRLTTEAELEPCIQDALDLIEFANGSVATEWGAVRARLGHPEPFGLEHIGLGNEESDPQFVENYPLFSNAIRERHPEIEVISNSGPFAERRGLRPQLAALRASRAPTSSTSTTTTRPSWFLANAHRYDGYDRAGPHVFLGEYAARATQYDNTFYSALTEAAFMTGLERNSDVVEMASYAPLLANSSYVNWTPDAIWFDNARSYGSPSYHVQKLFGQNTGDTVVPTTLEATDAPAPPDIRGAGRRRHLGHAGRLRRRQGHGRGRQHAASPTTSPRAPSEWTPSGAAAAGASSAASTARPTTRSTTPGAPPATRTGPTTRWSSPPARSAVTRAS